MRRVLVGACVLVFAMSTLVVAAPKKKKKKHKKTDTTETNAGSGSAGAEIEMDASTPTPTPDASVTTTAPPANEQPVPGPTVVASARPLAINDRPLTLGKDQFEVHGGLPIAVVTVPDLMGNNVSSTAEGFAFGGTYGLDPKTELGVDYAISLNPGDVKGPLTLHAAYSLSASPKLDIALAGGLVIHPVGVTDPVSMMSSTTTYLALELGGWVRYRLAPKLTAFTGLPALPHPDVSLARTGFPFPPMPYQLTIGVNNSGAIALALPVGVGIQATPEVYLYAATTLANFKITHTVNAFLFADFIPFTLGGFYSLPKFDVGAVFSDDLKQAGDYLTFSLVARYFVK